MKFVNRIKFIALSSFILAVIFIIAALERYFAGAIDLGYDREAKMEPGALFFLYGAFILFSISMILKFLLSLLEKHK